MVARVEERQLRVYCPTHKINFEVPEASRILCEGGGHSLAQDFPHGDFWEYCCDCQVFRPSEMDKGGKAKEQCPVCSRSTARRFVCGECKLVSLESDDPAKRKAFRITTRGDVEPSCPGCLKTTNAELYEHVCEDVAAILKTARQKCPFCEEPVIKKETGPFCGNCGTQAKQDEAFCKQCGRAVGAAARRVPAVKRDTPPDNVPAGLPEGPTTPYTQPQSSPAVNSLDTAPLNIVSSIGAAAEASVTPAPVAKKGNGAVLAVIVVIGLLGFVIGLTVLTNKGGSGGSGGSVNVNSSSANQFTPKLNRALAASDFFKPCSECVETLWDEESLRSPNSSALTEAATKIRNTLEPEGTATFDRYYAESDNMIDWDYTTNIYRLLQKVAPNEPSFNARYAYCIALTNLKNKNYVKAESSFKDALRYEPNWVLAYNGLGRVYIQDESPLYNEMKAEDNYKKACNSDTNFIWGCRNLGAYYAKVQSWYQAEEYMEEALRRAPNRDTIWKALKNICPKVGKYQNTSTGNCD